MDSKDNIRRQKLIRYIKFNNPYYLFTSFENYSIEMLEILKKRIDEEIKSNRAYKMSIHLN